MTTAQDLVRVIPPLKASLTEASNTVRDVSRERAAMCSIAEASQTALSNHSQATHKIAGLVTGAVVDPRPEPDLAQGGQGKSPVPAKRWPAGRQGVRSHALSPPMLSFPSYPPLNDSIQATSWTSASRLQRPGSQLAPRCEPVSRYCGHTETCSAQAPEMFSCPAD